MSLQIASPFQQFFDRDGSPLDNGFVYIGTANLNPETNPLTVYFDDALTIPAAQPLRTSNGYIVRNGSPARLYTSQEDFSLTVREKNSVLVYTVADATSLSNLQTQLAAGSGSSLVGYNQGGAGAVNRTVQSRLRDFVSVKDFGAVGNGVVDDTVAVQAALDSGAYGIFVPDGTYIVNAVTGSDVYLFGSGTIKKKSATKGQMITLTGDNVVEGITLDYDWTNATQTLPYFANISLRQNQGVITVRDCKFVRSFARALYVEGATLTLSGSSFAEGAPHNNQSGGNERVTSYLDVVADLLTDEQFIEVTGNTFVGPSLDPADLHLNTSGIFITAQALDGVRYKSVNIVGNTLIACSQNAGAGNVTGAIDTYNGVENLVISGNTIRLFSYAGIKVQNSSNFAITGNTITGGAAPVGASVAQSFGIISTEKVRGATAEQSNGTIANNVIQDCQYIGISNSCDNVVISGNIIDGVVLATLGNGINNTASYVNIVDNVGRNVEGTFVSTTGGNRIKIIGNTFQSDTVASVGAVNFTGSDIDISHNSFVSSLASAGSGIRTNGPSSNIRTVGNFVDGYPYGIDVRTTGGAVDRVNIADNQFANISVLNINVASGVTNASISMDVLPLVTATYDPPSLAVGNASPVQTTTVTGAVLGDDVVATGGRDMLGLFVVAWVSAADTIKWYVLNPTGNPNGTQDLGSTVFRFRVQKTV
jgi:parallel beta-helix repeat protein